MFNVYEIPKKSVFGCYSQMTGIDFLVMVEEGDFEKAKEIAQTELEKWSTGEPEDYENLGYLECIQEAYEKEGIDAHFYDEVEVIGKEW